MDALLEHFDFDPRDESEAHDAIEDCKLAAKVYMKLTELRPPKKSELGFEMKWTKDD